MSDPSTRRSPLREEIRQKRPFESPQEEAFLNLMRTTSLLQQSLARALKAWRLTPTQYNVLRILRGAHPDTLPCQEVGSRMVTPQPDVTRLLDRLESNGLVSRGRDTPDRRVVRAGITPEGLSLLAELDEPVRRWLASTLGHFDPQQLESAVRFLELARTRL
ncbi:MAG: MarR family transcriptional regulator [Acidobacteria bacterium]|nr:MarR family transcriptional regulator [Acidobacteriota bacterium]